MLLDDFLKCAWGGRFKEFIGSDVGRFEVMDIVRSANETYEIIGNSSSAKVFGNGLLAIVLYRSLMDVQDVKRELTLMEERRRERERSLSQEKEARNESDGLRRQLSGKAKRNKRKHEYRKQKKKEHSMKKKMV